MVNNTLPLGGGAVLTVVPPGVLDRTLAAADKAKAWAEDEASRMSETTMTNIAGFIRTQFEMMRNHRNNTSSGWSERLLSALRAFNGQYDAAKLAEIKKFGGSDVYARIVAMKCRGASSLLRDVYLQSERPWGLQAGPDPSVPPEIMTGILQLVQSEVGTASQGGTPPDQNAIRDRVNGLLTAARQAAKKKNVAQADIAEDKIDEYLIEGGFYKSLAEFLVDLPLFPFACIKGPIVRIVPGVTWKDGTAITTNSPKLFWTRVSPFDIWWTPGVSDIEDASVIERTRLTRADLNDLLGMPGYNEDEVRAVLTEYGNGGLNDHWDQTDAERADMESRENPLWNRSGLITCLEFNGNVQGIQLLQYGLSPDQVPDAMRDYMIQAWLIGTHVIKVQLSPSPRKRHPYFVTSFEKVPGTPVGNGLPDILADVSEVCNASLRTLVNNLSISSGPQVVINEDLISDGEDADNMYPWKRWRTRSPMLGQNQGTSGKAIDFFQPHSNAQELLAVYQKFNDIADDLSAIPRYLSGQSAGGAGRTASGLAMLMGNASKILQTVAANIDRDILDPLLTSLFDMIMLTDDSGLLTGEESIKVLGVTVAIQRETQRSRQLEFLQITANPIDMGIIGPKGRAEVLRGVANEIGMVGADIVPSTEELQKQAMQAEQQKQLMAQQAAQAQGNQQSTGATGDTAPRTTINGGGH